VSLDVRLVIGVLLGANILGANILGARPWAVRLDLWLLWALLLVRHLLLLLFGRLRAVLPYKTA
jgi:hypothetical protein